MKCPKCGMEYSGTACTHCGYLTPPPTVLAEDGQNKSVLIVLCVVGGILAVATGIVLMLGTQIHEKTSAEAEKSSFSKPDNIPEVGRTESDLATGAGAQQQSKGIYESGDYAIGDDIPAGMYLFLSNELGYGDFYCSVHTSSSMSNESVIWHEWGQKSRYVILEEGQYLHFSHATLYDLEKSEIVLNPYQSSGMFQVGRDIEAGTYTLVGTYDQGGGGYTIYSALNSSGGVVRDVGYFPYGDEAEVTLYEGEYIAMKHCRFEAEE